jgi:competence protein ComEA
MPDKRKLELAAYAVAAFVLVFLALKLLHRDSGGVPVALEPSAADAKAPPAQGSAPRTPKSTLVVDVAGEVRRPGVYRVPAGSRADAAVELAGGVTGHAERAAVNLAMPLHDGQQVVVPRHGAALASTVTAGAGPGAGAGEGPGSGASAAGGAPGQPISLSTATVEQLDTLDGIGPTLAARIVQYRDAHGGFKSVDELRQVSGIGDKRFAALRKSVQP